MRIVIIGPGLLPIPPKGWGAVENLIHEYRVELERNGWDVCIVNTSNRKEIPHLVNGLSPDFVHCQYDSLIDLMPLIQCKAKAVTSHFGYIDNVWDYAHYIDECHVRICEMDDVALFTLSPSIAEVYLQDRVNPQRIFVTPNGVAAERIIFNERPLLPNRSICLGKVEFRKRQGLVQQSDDTVDFAGNLCPDSAVKSGFDPTKTSYLGEWTRETVQNRLTEYSSLVLISKGEAHALVCMEALAAGLGLVISEQSTANLDLSKPYISVIPDSRINDKEYVQTVIRQNRETAIRLRKDIRLYGESFSWVTTTKRYMDTVRQIVDSKSKKMTSNLRIGNKKSIALLGISGNYSLSHLDNYMDIIRNSIGGKYDLRFHWITDRPSQNTDGVTYHPLSALPFPLNEIFKFHLIKSIFHQLSAYHVIMFAELEGPPLPLDLSVLEHRLFACSSENSNTGDKRELLWGGRFLDFKALITRLVSRVQVDLECDRVVAPFGRFYLYSILRELKVHLKGNIDLNLARNELPIEPLTPLEIKGDVDPLRAHKIVKDILERYQIEINKLKAISVEREKVLSALSSVYSSRSRLMKRLFHIVFKGKQST